MEMHPKRRVMDVIVIDGIVPMPSPRRTPELEKWETMALSGLVETASFAGEYELNEPPSRIIELDDLARGTGEWMALLRSAGSRKEYMIMADYFGFGRVHYALTSSRKYSGTSTLVASLTQRGVLAELSRRGSYSSEVNWDVALPHLISDVAIFKTRASDRTFSPKVHVLPRNSVIVAGASSVGIVNRPAPTFGRSEYDALIEQGIEGMIEDSRLAMSGGESKTFSLSGGRDSRALMAIFAAGGLTRGLEVVTDRSISLGASGDVFRRDLELASKMVDRFDLDWKVSGNGIAVPATFQEVLDDTLDSRSNEVFEIAPRFILIEDRGEVSFMGMGGEYYRSYIGAGYQQGFPNWWKNADRSPAGSRKDLAELFRQLVKPQRIPKELYADALVAFVNSMSIIDGNVIDQLETSFDEYRSRAHAGNIEWMRVGGTRTYYPLARPEFEAASRLLSPHDYSHGRVVFDIIEKSCPDLNVLPLESKPWPVDFDSQGEDRAWEEASVGRANQKYEDAKRRARPLRRASRSIENYDFHKQAIARVGERVDGWRGMMPANWHDGLLERIARLAVKSDASVRSLLIAVESVGDAIRPPNVGTHSIVCDVIGGDVEFIRLVARSSEIAPPLPAGNLRRFGDELTAVDVSSVRAELNLFPLNNSARVDIIGLPERCEVAVYLYSDGAMLTRTPYALESSFVFPDLSVGVAVDRATVFVRWVGDVDATRVFDVPVSTHLKA